LTHQLHYKVSNDGDNSNGTMLAILREKFLMVGKVFVKFCPKVEASALGKLVTIPSLLNARSRAWLSKRSTCHLPLDRIQSNPLLSLRFGDICVGTINFSLVDKAPARPPCLPYSHAVQILVEAEFTSNISTQFNFMPQQMIFSPLPRWIDTELNMLTKL
jgi:hypothetical protein